MNPIDMTVVDANTAALGISKSVLMENAGKCIADIIFGQTSPCKVVIFAGTGGNGGDGLVAARYLLNKGYTLQIYFLGNESQIKMFETRTNLKILQKIGLKNNALNIDMISDSSQLELINASVIVDAILGTGIKGLLREPVSSAIDIINNSNGIKIAVDVPTGLDPLTGNVNDRSVKANVTVTFHREKTGLRKAKSKFVGTIHVCDIGIPQDAEKFTGPGDL